MIGGGNSTDRVSRSVTGPRVFPDNNNNNNNTFLSSPRQEWPGRPKIYTARLITRSVNTLPRVAGRRERVARPLPPKGDGGTRRETTEITFDNYETACGGWLGGREHRIPKGGSGARSLWACLAYKCPITPVGPRNVNELNVKQCCLVILIFFFFT